MQKYCHFLSVILTLLLSACGSYIPTTQSSNPTETAYPCPVTKPPDVAFTPPTPYPRAAPSGFWYGTDNLWTALPWSGTWSSLPHNSAGYTQKVFWWRKDYFWKNEPQPQLSVSGRRLDAQAPPLRVSPATNVFAEDIQSAMLVGVDFPTYGCWEITGRYAESELHFVVHVIP